MTKHNKLIEKIRRPASSWAWSELCSLLIGLGYRQLEGSGSRVKFDNGDALDLINLHRPQPGNEVKSYVIAQVREKLQTGGLI
jgi:hypothetical protein